MNLKLQYQLSNGEWSDCGNRAEEFITRCLQINHVDANGKIVHHSLAVRSMTRSEVLSVLSSGGSVSHGEDWYSNVRSGSVAETRLAAQRAQQAQVKMVRCSCGHSVPQGSVMSASLGTACPDCYDRLSD